MGVRMSIDCALTVVFIFLTIHAEKTTALLGRDNNHIARANLACAEDSDSWSYDIPSAVQNGTSQARFNISTPGSTLSTETLLALDSPQLSSINASVFDWWYFDAVSDTDPRESLVVTLFTSSAAAFPFLSQNESSVLIAYIWASFANGTIFAEYVPATVATVSGDDETPNPSSGLWSSTGFSWTALKDDLSQYEIIVSSKEMQVEGTFSLTSGLKPHLPCGIQPETSILEIAPHIGWANVMPDAMGAVAMEIQGSTLAFQGPAYHDKNWSDRPFMESVQSWYWGHGRLGPYSIVWFSYLALDDPTNTTYVSSYVARDGEVRVSTCDASALMVRPFGGAGTTSDRYPPHAGDIPNGFHLEFDLGGSNGWLRVNVSVEEVVAGDGQYYMRWTGHLTGEVVQMQSEERQACGATELPRTKRDTIESLPNGVAVFEQFALVE